MAEILAAGTNVTIYAGSGCVNAHDEVVALAARLNAPVAQTCTRFARKSSARRSGRASLRCLA
jgi:thiamine pyrophosphate-dependent acetolactate synthase large subunit-like protein